MSFPVFIGAGTAVGGTAQINPSWGVHRKDTVGILLVHTNNQTLATPDGWTLIPNSGIGTGTAATAGAVRLYAFWRRALTSNETAVYVADSSDHQFGQILKFDGCATIGNPFDITVSDVDAVGSAVVSIPGGTTTVRECLVLVMVANGTDIATSQSSGWANNALNNLTEIVSSNTTLGFGGGFSVAAGEVALPSTFAATSALLATSSLQVRLVIALKPPTGPATSGFFLISPVDPSVTPGFEQLLSPAPTSVEYPGEANAEKMETEDGRLIMQQPTTDARVRSWVWKGFPGFLTRYELQFQMLQTFRSRYRQEAGLVPYVWIKDTVTKKLRKRVSVTVTAASSANTTTAITLTAPATVVQDAVVEVLPVASGGTGTGAFQIRNILAMTSTLLTVQAFNTVPNGAKLRITGWIDDWVRVRVLDVSRKFRDDGGVIRYDTTTFQFVIEDTTWNDLG